MTLINKVQRAAVPALRPFLPKMPVQFFHSLHPKANLFKTAPTALISINQRTVLSTLRPYSSDNQNDDKDKFNEKKETALYAPIAFSTGFLYSTIVKSAHAKELKPADEPSKIEPYNENELRLIASANEICEEISDAFDLPIEKVKKYLSRKCFNSESEFASHVVWLFKANLTSHNFEREEKGLHPITINLAFKQYCAARFFITQNLKYPMGTDLNLSGRDLFILPPELMECKHLTRLDISNNHLSYIPNNINQLENLVILKAQNNKITKDPTKLLNSLPKLKIIYLSNNPFEHEREEGIGQFN